MTSRVHINLGVSDLEASIAFYSTLLGVPPTKRKPDYANYRLDEPAIHLALVADPRAALSPPSSGHFGVEVADSERLSRWHARVRAADVPVRTETGVTCCYATGDKFWASDPDGHEWEMWVRTGEAETMYAESDAGGCECA